MSVEVTTTIGIFSVSAISFSIIFKAILSFASNKFCDCFTLGFFIFFRHNVSLKINGGESKSVTKAMNSSWSETTLPTILSNYKLEDIFNADEFGLFYQCLPDKTYHLKGEKCSGKKKAKSGLLEWQQQVRQEKNCPCL